MQKESRRVFLFCAFWGDEKVKNRKIKHAKKVTFFSYCHQTAPPTDLIPAFGASNFKCASYKIFE